MFKIWSLCACTNSDLLMSPIIYIPAFTRNKISPFHFWNYLNWYEAENYTRGTKWELKLSGHVINMIDTWDKWPKLCCYLLSPSLEAIPGSGFNFIPFLEVKIPRGVYTPPSSLRTMHIKQKIYLGQVNTVLIIGSLKLCTLKLSSCIYL